MDIRTYLINEDRLQRLLSDEDSADEWLLNAPATLIEEEVMSNPKPNEPSEPVEGDGVSRDPEPTRPINPPRPR